MISGHQINGQNNAKTWDCDWGCLFGGQIHTVIWGRGLQKEGNPLVSLTVKLTSLGKLDSCKDKMHDWKRSVISSTISEYALGTGLKILHLKNCTSHVNLRKIVKSPLQSLLWSIGTQLVLTRNVGDTFWNFPRNFWFVWSIEAERNLFDWCTSYLNMRDVYQQCSDRNLVHWTHSHHSKPFLNRWVQ
jgi:hypothetical protein